MDPDAQLILSQTEGTLASAETLQLTARLSSGEGPITWRSSDPSVAAVSPEGVVTNVYAGSGEAAVTITASCGPLTAEAVLRCGPAGQIGVVTAEPNLRVRSGPSQEEPVISHLNTGSRVVLLDTETPGWYQVLFSDAAGQAVTGLGLRRLHPPFLSGAPLIDPARSGIIRGTAGPGPCPTERKLAVQP